MAFAVKIGARLASGMGEIVLDFSREVANLIGSSLVYGPAGAVAAGDAGGCSYGNGTSEQNPEQKQECKKLEGHQEDAKSKQIAEKFGL